MTAVLAFGVRDGTGQNARERWVSVGMCFARLRNRGQEIVEGGWERERCVRWGIVGLRERVMLSSQDISAVSWSSGGGVVGFWTSSMSCLKLTDRPTEPERSSL